MQKDMLSFEDKKEQLNIQRQQARKYKDQFVTFIDILGFAEFIERSDGDPELTAKIYDAITSATSGSPYHGPPSYPKGLRYSPHTITKFSDSIVISSSKNGEGLMTVLELGRAFSCILLQCGLLTRGGVAGGNLIHEEGLIFGPAMVSAYYLESKHARFARIILDSECVDLYEEEIRRGSPTCEYFEKTIRQDVDNRHYLHVLRELEDDAKNKENHEMHQWWWGEAKRTVQNYLQTSKGKSYWEKSEWFAKYYNTCVGSSDEEGLSEWRRQIEIK